MKIDSGALLDYALGNIDPRKAREVEAVLSERPELAAGLRAMQDGLAELVLRLPPIPVSEEDEENVIATARLEASSGSGSRRRRSRPGGGPLWAALALAATLGLGAWLVFQRIGPSRAGQPEGAPQLVSDTSGDRAGMLIRLADGSLFLAFDEPPGPDQDYRLWRVDGDEATLLGIADGRAVHVPDLPQGSRLRVTRAEERWIELRP